MAEDQSARCFAGQHVPVWCSVTGEAMCRYCYEHGFDAAVRSDLWVRCPLHQATQALPVLPRESALNQLCIVIYHRFPWISVDDAYGLLDLVDDLDRGQIDVDPAALRRLALLCEEQAGECRRYAARALLSGRFGRRRAQRARRVAAARLQRRRVGHMVGRILEHAARQLTKHAAAHEAGAAT